MNKINYLYLLGLMISWTFQSFGQINFEEVTTSIINVEKGDAVFGDVDGDNDKDLLISGEVQGPPYLVSYLYLNDGFGNFTREENTPFIGTNKGSTDFADIDGDNDLDVLITGNSFGNDVAELYLNEGAGTFILAENTNIEGVSNSAAEFFDADGDGDFDLITIGLDFEAKTRLYLNNGTGEFTPLETDLTDFQAGDLAIADVDGDGDLDLLLSGNTEQMPMTKLYLNNGSATFTEVNNTPFADVMLSALAFADIDGDNDEDVLITGKSEPSDDPLAVLYKNDGNGNFESHTAFFSIMNGSVAFNDLDNDNDFDLIISGSRTSGASTVLYVNDGNGNFSINEPFIFYGLTQSTIALVDMDDDADTDVLIFGTNNSINSTILYKNLLENSLSSNNDLIKQIKIYPNPFSSELIINSSSSHFSLTSATLYDFLGKEIQSFKLNNSKQIISLNFLDSGVYFLRIEKINYPIKIIKD